MEASGDGEVAAGDASPTSPVVGKRMKAERPTQRPSMVERCNWRRDKDAARPADVTHDSRHYSLRTDAKQQLRAP